MECTQRGTQRDKIEDPRPAEVYLTEVLRWVDETTYLLEPSFFQLFGTPLENGYFLSSTTYERRGNIMSLLRLTNKMNL